MDDDNFETQACKNLLLYPRSIKESDYTKLKLNVDDTEASSSMTREFQFEEGEEVDGVFLSCRTSFIITDDLNVALNSMGLVLNVLNDHGYDGFDKLQEMLIDVGFEETRIETRWSKPAWGRLKCNMHTSWTKDIHHCGGAWLLRNHVGDAVLHARDAFLPMFNREAAELHCILWCLQSLHQVHVDSCEIWSDCTAAIRALAQPNDWPKYRSILYKIVQVIRVMRDVSFPISSLKANSLARDIVCSVTRDGRFNSYLASGGPACGVKRLCSKRDVEMAPSTNSIFVQRCWNIRKMVEIKSIFKSMIRCQLRNGLKASFWFDSWTNLGPLIDIFGAMGPRELRIRRDATVWEATRDGQWHFLMHDLSLRRSCRYVCLMWTHLLLLEALIGINGSSHLVPSLKNSLPREHGCRLDKSLLMCLGVKLFGLRKLSQGLDSHDHLFFECEFSRSVWVSFAEKISPNPPISLSSASLWVLSVQSSPPHFASKILKLLLQTSIYLIWKERNRRVFSAEANTIYATKSLVDRTMHNRLISFSLEDTATRISLLGFYFGCINSPP
ncbi:unnamed protein product [Arabidopsis lyrata]|nr:unnamed protein product [Arabidopsis lyrata]